LVKNAWAKLPHVSVQAAPPDEELVVPPDEDDEDDVEPPVKPTQVSTG
jgi:hypothetical protein